MVGMIFFSFSPVVAQDVSTNFKWVVQVMSYDNIYGLYPVLRWRGSASIISSDGLIMTNSHVVTKENGNPLTSFAICVSDSISARPVCKYTASLIVQDSDRDIALLRIDSTDINGAKVNYSVFTPLPIDTKYIPSAQDQTVAIWYPSVWAETITQTVGVVAGSQTYNGYSYIKTDTAIAPGSSGWPLLHDGKIIGINTFSFWWNLWYALLVSEVTDFIQKYSHSDSIKSIISTSTFQSYLASSQTIQNQKYLSDKVFSFSFLKSYVITNYIVNKMIMGQLQSPDDTNIQSFSLQIKQVSTISTDDDIIYLLKKNYGYNPRYHTLTKEIISGITMYSFNYSSDLSAWDSQSAKIYIGKYDTNSIIELVIELPSLSDNSKQDNIKRNIADFVSWISFKTGYISPKISSFVMNYPKLNLKMIKNMVVNIVDIADNSLGFYTNPFAVFQLPTTYESMTYTLVENSIELGKTNSLQERFSITTEWISTTNKSLVSYNGHNGFVFCTEQPTDAIGYESSIINKQWKYVDMGLCRMVLYLGEDEETILYIDLNVEKSKLWSYQKRFLNFITTTLQLPKIWNGNTNLPKQIMQSRSLNLSGAADQSNDFNSYLNLLVRYGIVPQWDTINLSNPMTYKSYLTLYLKALYNISEDKTDLILKSTGINPDAYMDKDMLPLFSTLVKLRMSGVSLSDYSQKTIKTFELLSQTTYKNQRKKIQDWEYSIFKGIQFHIDDALPNIDISYMPYTSYLYDQIGWLQSYINYNEQWSLSTPEFGLVNIKKNQDMIVSCSNKPMMDKSCISFYKKLANQIYSSSLWQYQVVTYGEALEYLQYLIDISLFDSQWKDKKNI